MMNRLLTLCLLFMASLWGYAQDNGNGAGGYDPATPGDPSTPVVSYVLSFEANPKGTGSFYDNNRRYPAGTEVYVEAYENIGYKFVKWMEGDKLLSTDRYFNYTMPAKKTKLTAYYEYSPALPGDPDTPNEYHYLILQSTPNNSASFYDGTRKRLEVGQSMSVYASPNNGYRFVEWRQNGKVISKTNPYEYRMGNKTDTLTAVMVYDPQTPADPSVNYWNPETGEAIIDRFLDGEFLSALYDKVGNLDEIKSLTIAGSLHVNELSFLRECRAIENLDMSRTYGWGEVTGSFGGNYWWYNYVYALQNIILPSCVSEIQSGAFSACDSLRSITCYALTPPALATEVCETLKGHEDLVVYVPAEALLLYTKAEGWSELNIMPIKSDARSIKINLPEEANDGRYAGMTIHLTNDASGQNYRYIVTDRVAYVFNNLLKKSTYTAQLLNKQGVELARIAKIAVAEKEDVTVDTTFTNIKSIFSPSVTVLDAAGNDVTAETTVTWMNAKGQYIKQGASLDGVIQGTAISYKVALSEKLSMDYLTPAVVTDTIETEADTKFTTTLSAIPTATLTGKVVNADNEPIVDAIVTVSQKIGGMYPKTAVVKTTSDGAFSTEVKWDATWGDATVAVSAADYVGLTRKIAADTIANENLFVLKSITGAVVNIALSYQKSAEASKPVVLVSGYADYTNVTYTLYNKTQDKEIKEYNVQYPKIVLLEEVADGDEIEVSAISTVDAFNTVKGTAVMATVGNKQSATAEILIVERGGMKAEYLTTDNAKVVGALYDNNGELVQKQNYENKSISFGALHDGTYTLLSMAQSDLFNDFMKLSSLTEAGLVKGTDYVLNTVKVKSGVIASVVNQIIPFFDETKVYYTGTLTSFSVNKSSVVAGNFLTLKATIDFKGKYKDAVSNKKFIVDLPSSCQYMTGSLMLGNAVSKTDFTVYGDRLTIDLDDDSQLIRFCITPNRGGEYAPNAFVEFTYEGRTILQPIGNAPFTVKDLTIVVPSKTAKAEIPVSGVAKKGAEISVYADGVLLAQTTAKANGSWATVITLQNPAVGSEHPVYADVVLKDGTEMKTETKTVTFDESYMDVAKVEMYHNNPEMNRTYKILFDFHNPKNKPGNYIYYIYNRRFSFIITLAGTPCDDLYLIVYTAKGKVKKLKMQYDPAKKYYIASGDFGNYYDGDLPVNVAISECTMGTIPSNNDDCSFGIDPSGYVYEAVKSNRLEGVTATAYYREKVYEEYFDIESAEYKQRWTGDYDVIKWDAEEYAQENPLFTDADGMYRWDVPTGEWQVKFEKDGYESTQSEWLPVPPPQLEVNIPMTTTTAPTVTSVTAFEDYLEIDFSMYMDPSTLNSLNITLTKGKENIIAGIEPVGTAADLEDGYCKKVRVTYEGTVLQADNLTLTVSETVQSYAGIQMDESYSQEFHIERKIKSLDIVKNVNLVYDPYQPEKEGHTKQVVVSAAAEDAVGKTVRIASSEEMIVTVVGDSEAKFDDDGNATFTVKSEMPGYANLLFTVDNETVTGSAIVNVTREARKADNPVATKANGSSVYHNSNIVLTTETKDATIYYTTDGSAPSEKNGTAYTEPIVMDDAKTIKAIAVAEAYDNSDIVEYSYTMKRSDAGLALEKGWSWISHNLEGEVSYDVLLQNNQIERLIGQETELYKDPDWGLVGNLTSLRHDEAYKVQMSETSTLKMSGYEANALETPINLSAGWNWVGYPVSQETTLDEAFAYAKPNAGDVIVTKDDEAQAEFDGVNWTGALKTLVPGMGYMYNAKQAFTFMYNTNLVSNARSLYAVKDVNHTPWNCDVHQYPNVMCMVADVYKNNVKAEAGEYYVAAFCGDECRGIGKYVDGVLHLTVHGNGGEMITFRACEVAAVKERVASAEWKVVENMEFTDQIAGSISCPFVLTVGDATSISNVTGNAKAVNVSYDLAGRRIYKAKAKGVYIRNGRKEVVR